MLPMLLLAPPADSPSTGLSSRRMRERSKKITHVLLPHPISGCLALAEPEMLASIVNNVPMVLCSSEECEGNARPEKQQRPESQPQRCHESTFSFVLSRRLHPRCVDGNTDSEQCHQCQNQVGCRERRPLRESRRVDEEEESREEQRSRIDRNREEVELGGREARLSRASGNVLNIVSVFCELLIFNGFSGILLHVSNIISGSKVLDTNKYPVSVFYIVLTI